MSVAVSFDEAVAWVAAGIDPPYRPLVDMPAVARAVFTQTPAGWVRTGDDAKVIVAMSRNSKDALEADRLYVGYDRIVCGRVTCAGSAAVSTGIDLHGRPVVEATARDVREWAAQGFEAMTCECESVTRRPGEAMA